jgi:ABC-type Fe3+/spermidine/putrescine transport system ATPase subunit
LGGEIRRIQQETQVTALYVTHDQSEAFLLSDRIAVMSAGRILQVAAPADVYANPADMFVARFVGETNAIPGTVTGARGANALVDIGGRDLECRADERLQVGDAVDCVLRPEDIDVYPGSRPAGQDPDRHGIGHATVEARVFAGARYRLSLSYGSHKMIAETDESRAASVGTTVSIDCRRGAPFALKRTSGQTGMEMTTDKAQTEERT